MTTPFLHPLDDQARALQLAHHLRALDWQGEDPAVRSAEVITVINHMFRHPLNHTAAGWIMSYAGVTGPACPIARFAVEAWCAIVDATYPATRATAEPTQEGAQEATQ